MGCKHFSQLGLFIDLFINKPPVRHHGHRARNLLPKTHSGSKAKDAINQLCKDTCDCLEVQKLEKLFVKALNQYDYIDVVVKEFTKFQIEIIPEECSSRDFELLKVTVSRSSYRTTCYDQFHLFDQSKQSTTTNQSSTADVECYWKNHQMNSP